MARPPLRPKSISKASGVDRVEGCQDERQQWRSPDLMLTCPRGRRFKIKSAWIQEPTRGLDAHREKEAAAPSLAGCYTAALVGRSADRAPGSPISGIHLSLKNV